jgi:hypothetical protein
MAGRLPALIAGAVLASAGDAQAQDRSAHSDEFKAAIILNLARFASWPPPRFLDAAQPVVLCVDPNDRLAGALGRLQGQPVGARTLQVRLTPRLGPGCHMALVPVARSSAEELLALRKQGVLTVGEAPGFARSGAVGLVQVGRQVRFEINAAASREAGVGLSSQLMRLAVAVRQ